MTPTAKRWIPGLLACGVVVAMGSGWLAVAGAGPGDAVTAGLLAGAGPSRAVQPNPVDPRESALRVDARVTAFQRAYGPWIDSVSYRDDDLVFALAGQEIYFQDGRMLAEASLDRRDECSPIFYRYPLDMPTEPEPVPEEPVRLCTDLQEVLWGRTEAEIRRRARSTTFIGRKVFVNDVVADALVDVERDILTVAPTDPAVASWIDDVNVAYSFMDRGIAGTGTRSQHAFGLAVDLVPDSYEGRQVYWRWSRALNRGGWHRTPLERRWSPPASVIAIFERHGFVWGGKWAHFDNIHFEYRPEILEYNRLLEADSE